MTDAIIGPVICACGWAGELSRCAGCPACNRPFNDRVTAPRLAALRAISADPQAWVEPMMRIRLRELALIAGSGPPPTPGHAGRVRGRRVRRPFTLTTSGIYVLRVADQLVVAQTRHDVAASVVRHAELPTCTEDHEDHDAWTPGDSGD